MRIGRNRRLKSQLLVGHPQDDPGLRASERKRQIQRLTVSDEWVTHQAVQWGYPQWNMEQVFRDSLADVALIRLRGFDPTKVPNYPTFRNPSADFKVGTSLCRLGHPFHDIKATFDDSTGIFSLDPATFPIAQFPNDGILTRFVAKNSSDGSRQVQFIETSTAGLRGQSGGPIFDRNSHVWAVQSQTASLPLGFAPVIKLGSREIVEHQFMHLGWGSHIKHAIELMVANQVSFAMVP
jgi:Trypsin-like peptidase domain